MTLPALAAIIAVCIVVTIALAVIAALLWTIATDTDEPPRPVDPSAPDYTRPHEIEHA